MSPGDQVRVLAPFETAFPGVYTVEAVRTLADGSTAVTIQGTDFDPEYLVKV